MSDVRALSSKFLIPLLTMWAAAFGGSPLGGRVVLGVVVANRSGDHSTRMHIWRHSSEALNRLLGGSLERQRIVAAFAYLARIGVT
jgi:hypothetical protein